MSKMIEKYIEELYQNGSDKDSLESLKKDLHNLSKGIKDNNPKDVIKELILELQEKSFEFLNERNDNGYNYIYSLSSSMYLPDFESEGYKINFLGGKENTNSNSKLINKNTLFDVASITKLFTIILLFKLEEKGIININDKVSYLHSDFKGLEEFTINDLLLQVGEIRTAERVDEAQNKEEAYEKLKTAYIYSSDRSRNLYTDLGAIIISKIIEKIISEKIGLNINYDEIMKAYILDPYGLSSTTFNPSLNHSLTGNGNDLNQVHDPKARKLGGAVGSAGLFTNSLDLEKLSLELFKVEKGLGDIVTRENLKKLGTITFPNSNISQKGYLGIYQKHPLGLAKTWVPSQYSEGSFAYQGWTGPVAVFDSKNQIHNNFLVGAVPEERVQNDKELYKNNKPIGFGNKIEQYQYEVSMKTLQALFVKKYFDFIDRRNNKIDITIDLNK